jgi:hypothetical protein
VFTEARHEVVNDRRISNMKDVVAEIVTIEPYKKFTKGLKRERNKHPSKAISSVQTTH